MLKPKYKIGYSNDGGIFVGKIVRSDFHKHHSIAVILAFGEPFELIDDNNMSNTYEAALIPKDILYKLSSGDSDYMAFAHIDPYSEIGIMLTQYGINIQNLNRCDFSEILNSIKEWFEGTDNSTKKTELLLHSIATTVLTNKPHLKEIDQRILKCIQCIREIDDNVSLEKMSEQVYLSPSRLSHLFKKETGLTYRQFLLHSKMVKSLHAIYNQCNLSEASFFGGFSDQPHFIKTFRNNFGIKPSNIKT